jgi:alkylhydroperoxidase family enzyme
MPWIETIDEEDASGELRKLYEGCKDPVSGRVENVATIHSLHPAGLRAHFALYGAVMRGTQGLPKVDRELIAVVVSTLNGCHY